MEKRCHLNEFNYNSLDRGWEHWITLEGCLNSNRICVQKWLRPIANGRNMDTTRSTDRVEAVMPHATSPIQYVERYALWVVIASVDTFDITSTMTMTHVVIKKASAQNSLIRTMEIDENGWPLPTIQRL